MIIKSILNYAENILKKIAPFFGGRWKQIRA